MNEFEITFKNLSNTPTVNIALKHIFGQDCQIEWINNTAIISTNQVEEIKDINQLKGLKLKEELIKYSKDNFDKVDQLLVNEYIKEAEYQNSNTYWENFSDLDSLIEDVKLYIKSHD